MYILIHILTSQPALIKLDNENIGGHRYTFTIYRDAGAQALSYMYLTYTVVHKKLQ